MYVLIYIHYLHARNCNYMHKMLFSLQNLKLCFLFICLFPMTFSKVMPFLMHTYARKLVFKDSYVMITITIYLYLISIKIYWNYENALLLCKLHYLFYNCHKVQCNKILSSFKSTHTLKFENLKIFWIGNSTLRPIFKNENCNT